MSGALTNASFAGAVMRIAYKALSWAVDPVQAIGENAMPHDGTVPERKAEQFCSEIEALTAMIRRRAKVVPVRSTPRRSL